ncbi:hypothetical protein OkiPb00163_11520 [Escherichia coli]
MFVNSNELDDWLYENPCIKDKSTFLTMTIYAIVMIKYRGQTLKKRFLINFIKSLLW